MRPSEPRIPVPEGLQKLSGTGVQRGSHKMALQNVTLIEVGKPSWPRFMIFHTEKKRYWSKGAWKKRRRNGELWHDRAEAGKELHTVRLGS